MIFKPPNAIPPIKLDRILTNSPPSINGVWVITDAVSFDKINDSLVVVNGSEIQLCRGQTAFTYKITNYPEINLTRKTNGSCNAELNRIMGSVSVYKFNPTAPREIITFYDANRTVVLELTNQDTYLTGRPIIFDKIAVNAAIKKDRSGGAAFWNSVNGIEPANVTASPGPNKAANTGSNTTANITSNTTANVTTNLTSNVTVNNRNSTNNSSNSSVPSAVSVTVNNQTNKTTQVQTTTNNTNQSMAPTSNSTPTNIIQTNQTSSPSTVSKTTNITTSSNLTLNSSTTNTTLSTNTTKNQTISSSTSSAVASNATNLTNTNKNQTNSSASSNVTTASTTTKSNTTTSTITTNSTHTTTKTNQSPTATTLPTTNASAFTNVSTSGNASASTVSNTASAPLPIDKPVFALVNAASDIFDVWYPYNTDQTPGLSALPQPSTYQILINAQRVVLAGGCNTLFSRYAFSSGKFQNLSVNSAINSCPNNQDGLLQNIIFNSSNSYYFASTNNPKQKLINILSEKGVLLLQLTTTTPRTSVATNTTNPPK